MSAPTQPPKPSRSERPLAPPERVPESAKTLGQGWKAARDRAVTTAADPSGFNIIVADSTPSVTNHA
ncbi:hypothetical protein [Streptomyces incarnatus]|uniref:hypothetical protein n=1 Tax=Streptomyces incarnatus TaxID=665007 RepID=UPI000AF84F14|nr:hypothetical protein [Streptomyces incarnatus]